MTNSDLVSRSLLLLQYRLALDMMARENGIREHAPEASEGQGPGGEPECLA